MEINISNLAKSTKLLPSKKLISSRAFKIKKIGHDNKGFMDFHQENESPSLTGTAIDYMTRTFLLHDPNSHSLAVKAADILGTKEQQFELKEDILKYKNLASKADSINDLANEAFYLILKISAWEEAYRCGKYYPVNQEPTEQTIQHYKIMIARTANFFEQFGQPIETGYLAYIDNKQVHGDGDYLLPQILVDMKTSKKMITADWVRQLLLYYVLLRSEKTNTDEIKKLMIFNPRYDQLAYVKIKNIDYNILDFVLDQAEYVSKL